MTSPRAIAVAPGFVCARGLPAPQFQEESNPLWLGFPLHLPRPLGLRGSCPVGRAGAGKQVAGTTMRWSAASDSISAPHRHDGSGVVAVVQEEQGPCVSGLGVRNAVGR